MSPNYRLSDDAREDIWEIVEFIDNHNAAAANGFAPAVVQTLHGLAEFPFKGSPKEYDDLAITGVRSYAVNGYPNHLILYRVDDRRMVHVFAVTHGARDLEKLIRRRSRQGRGPT